MPVPDLQDALDLLQEKDIDAALEVLNDMVATVPAHVAAHVLRARAYEAQQQWEDALKAWQEVRLLLPNSPVAQEGLERVLHRMNTWRDERPVPLSVTEPTDDVPDAPPEQDAPSEEADAPPDALAQLRRRAEQEARQGGARSGLTGAPSSPATPEEQIQQFEAEEEDSDLDHLIDELESARIEPEPNPEDVPEPDLEDDVEDVVSETLAEIHVSQGDYEEAARIYSKLASQEPDQAEEYRQKAAEMRKKAGLEDST